MLLIYFIFIIFQSFYQIISKSSINYINNEYDTIINRQIRILDSVNQNNTDVIKKIINLKLLNLQNIYYSAEIYFGVKDPLYNLIVDTGSTITWIAGQECETCRQQGLNRQLDCSVENNCYKTNEQIQIDYGVGMVKGVVINVSTMMVQQNYEIPILLIDQIGQLNDFMGEGLIGLGKSYDNQLNIIELLFSAGIIPEPEFSLYLKPDVCKSDSVLTLGGILPTIKSGKWYSAQSNDKNFWSIQIQYQSMFMPITNNILIDSGTTKLLFPPDDIKLLINKFDFFGITCKTVKVNKGPMLSLDCQYQQMDYYPTLNFEINSTNQQLFNLTLSPIDYIQSCYFSIIHMERRCIMKIQEMNGPEIIFGIVFMQKYYTKFNLKKQTIGFSLLDRIVKQQKIYVEEENSFLHFEYLYYEQYLALLLILIIISSFIIILYCIGKVYLYQKMDFYAYALEKSSSRSDREQEMANLKESKNTPTILSIDNTPQNKNNNKLFDNQTEQQIQ